MNAQYLGSIVHQLRGNHLPGLRPLLKNQRHADLGLSCRSIDDAHQDAGITKHSHVCLARVARQNRQALSLGE